MYSIQKRYLVLIAGFILQLSCSTKPQTTRGLINEVAKARMDSTLKSLVDAGSIAGASVLIYENNQEVYFNAFGYADREASIPMDRKTLVRIYSMTKPITGTALMSLYEKGAFQLDDPLSLYAPEFTNVKVLTGVDEKGNMKLVEPNRPITIRDITRHTAGFATNTPDTTTAFGRLVKNANVMNLENTLAQMAEKLGSLPLTFHPGEQWAYGPSVDVQAFLVEKISGKPYEQYVRETILDPLKMTETRYFVPQADRNRLAAMYRKTDNGALERVPDLEANRFNTQRWALTPGGLGAHCHHR